MKPAWWLVAGSLPGLGLLAWWGRGTLLKPLFLVTTLLFWGEVPGSEIEADGSETPWYSDRYEHPRTRCHFGMFTLTRCYVNPDDPLWCEAAIESFCTNVYPEPLFVFDYRGKLVRVGI